MKLITLSPVFYERYRGCEEILIKQTRPYVCLAVKVDGVTFAISLPLAKLGWTIQKQSSSPNGGLSIQAHRPSSRKNSIY